MNYTTPYTSREAARLLGVTIRAVHRAVQRQTLTPIRQEPYLFAFEELRRYATERRQEPPGWTLASMIEAHRERRVLR